MRAVSWLRTVLRRQPFVSVMEATDFGDRDDPSSRCLAEQPVVWSVFG